MKKITFTFDLTDEAFNFLKEIETGSAEFRDPEFLTVDDFLKSEVKDLRTLEWFMDRNCEGRYYLIEELYKYDLVDCDSDAWHITFRITDMGREILKQNS